MTQQAVRLPPADDLPPPPSRPGSPERRRGAWLRRSFLVRGPRRVYRRWRRSLQQRVVASALLLSLLLAGLFAVNLVSQITRELVEQKTEAAQKVAVRATDAARRDLGALDKKTTKDNVAIQLDRAATEAVGPSAPATSTRSFCGPRRERSAACSRRPRGSTPVTRRRSSRSHSAR
jgi:type II secretory pathway pseudopilin PulG